MSKVAFLIACIASLASAADVRYTWLPFSSNVPGVAATATATTQYGVSVLMDSDNPKVTEFQVTIVVKRGNGTIVTATANVARDSKAANVMYSTLYSNLIDDSPDFEVLAVQVKAVSGISVTRPVPGMPYTSDSQ
ncbi:MAG TPA: hypothetical protein VG456_20390 [Candidatus Sulfopaludibacter sp.]|jgi:hypothetical protein|nr:hypothetical protein [Candidatus Sulfopaludibacter sp.]